MTTWRTRLTLMGIVMILIALLPLSLNSQRASASSLVQPPPPTDTPTDVPTPTNTPISPTDTPLPTSTLQPSETPVQSTPSIGSPTPIPPTRKPRSGGGAPPGPSGTPVINGCVKSVGKDGISLSTEPGFYQPHVQIIPRERLAQVLAGPERADSIWWWRLRTETGVEGWGNQDDMTPDPGPCAFGGSISAGGQTPPYPVTILPSFSLAQTPVIEQSPVQAVPLGQPAAQATPAQQETLPQTGDGLEGWFLAGLLAIIVMVVGFARRRLQAQAIATGSDRGNDEKDVKN